MNGYAISILVQNVADCKTPKFNHFGSDLMTLPINSSSNSSISFYQIIGLTIYVLPCNKHTPSLPSPSPQFQLYLFHFWTPPLHSKFELNFYNMISVRYETGKLNYMLLKLLGKCHQFLASI